MTDIDEITVKELTEYAYYCMGKIPAKVRAVFPGDGRDTVNEVRCDTRRGVEYPVIDACTGPEDRSFIIDIYGPGHRRVMAGRIWLNNGHIYLIDCVSTRTLYNKSPYGIETFDEFKARTTLPEVPKGILKIPLKL